MTQVSLRDRIELRNLDYADNTKNVYRDLTKPLPWSDLEKLLFRK